MSAVLASKKYRTVCTETVARIAAEELGSRDSLKETVKVTKRRLHQVYGAFESNLDYETALDALQAAYRSGDDDAVRRACRDVLVHHTSTRERLSLLDVFYPAIWEITGTPASVLDVGCGLNPLALPWMGLPPGARYVALDVDCERIDFVNRCLVIAGLAPLARCQDALVAPPQDRVDVALLLKMSPTLERQEGGATLRLVEQFHTPHVVVSYAVQSLGGREKGMIEQYGQQFNGWAEARNWTVKRLVFESELVFVTRSRHWEPIDDR
ncbi:MAG: 16S rRNA methyltransferase [Anaerolineae bacterium]|nr:16S rRNA methyltransferase [Anaerolineae bacterium]